jgi:dienelactone hydrolase
MRVRNTVLFAAAALASFYSQRMILSSPHLGRQIAKEAAAEKSTDRSLEFRDLFLGALDGQYTEEQMRQLVYLPTSSLTQITHQARTGEELLGIMADIQKGADPLALYEAGRAKPIKPADREQLEAGLAAAGGKTEDRLTVVIVPGIFGEFIKSRAYEEIFAQKKSVFRSLWRERVEAFKRVSASSEALKDKTFAIASVGEIERPIEDLFHVSSIDKNGQSLVNVVLFDTSFMSLESLGKMADRAATFSRRLNKFVEIMQAGGGAPSKIALLGYSRGTMLALEMLARAHEKPADAPWLANVKAMISLGGVVYGSDLADDAVNARGLGTPSASAQQLIALRELTDSLITPETAKAPASVIAKNTWHWNKFILKMGKLTALPEGAWSIMRLWEPGYAKQRGKDLWAQIQSIRSADSNAGIGIVANFGLKAFTLNNAVKDYTINVKRFKALAYAVLDGVPELATGARMNWWKENTVPASLKYYAITGTMVDDQGTGFQHELATNRTAYNPQLIDFGMLMTNYRAFRDYSGISVNDSQVAAYKVRFWNELNQLLNPEQEKLDINYLGVLGVHHWGLALKVVNEADARKVNYAFDPFPRTALMRAMSAIVVQDLGGK